MSTFETRQVIRDLVRSYMKTSNISSSSSPAPSSTLLSNLISQTHKGDIRYIQDDPLMRREKFDGSCWRLVCTWAVVRCTNFAYSRNLCTRHNAESQNKPVNKRQRRVHIERNRPTPISEPDRGPAFLYSPISTVSSPDQQTNNNDDGGDDDVQIIAAVYPVRNRSAHSVSSFFSLSFARIRRPTLHRALRSKKKTATMYNFPSILRTFRTNPSFECVSFVLHSPSHISVRLDIRQRRRIPWPESESSSIECDRFVE